MRSGEIYLEGGVWAAKSVAVHVGLYMCQCRHVPTCADGCPCPHFNCCACRLRPGVPPDAPAGWDNVSRLAEERQGMAVAADPGRALGVQHGDSGLGPFAPPSGSMLTHDRHRVHRPNLARH